MSTKKSSQRITQDLSPLNHSEHALSRGCPHVAEYPGGTSVSSVATRTFADDEAPIGCPFASKRTPESAWYVASWGTESKPASAALLCAWFGLEVTRGILPAARPSVELCEGPAWLDPASLKGASEGVWVENPTPKGGEEYWDGALYAVWGPG